MGACPVDERGRGAGGATGGEHVVHDQHSFPRREGVLMELSFLNGREAIPDLEVRSLLVV